MVLEDVGGGRIYLLGNYWFLIGSFIEWLGREKMILLKGEFIVK